MRIDIDALTVEIAGARLVDQATLGAADGQLVGLVGPNGSGKSTLLRCVYRALRPRPAPSGSAVRTSTP